MSVRLLQDALDADLPRGSEKIVLTVLAWRAGEDGRAVLPFDEMEDATSRDRQTLKAALKALQPNHLTREDRLGREPIWIVHPVPSPEIRARKEARQQRRNRRRADQTATGDDLYTGGQSHTGGHVHTGGEKHTGYDLPPSTGGNSHQGPGVILTPVHTDHDRLDNRLDEQQRGRAKPRKMPHRLPGDWKPKTPFTPQVQSIVDQWPEGALAHVEAEFVNYWSSDDPPDPLKKDWDRAFRDRILTLGDSPYRFRTKGQPSHGSNHQAGSHFGDRNPRPSKVAGGRSGGSRLDAIARVTGAR